MSIDPIDNSQHAHIIREDGVVAMREQVNNSDYSRFWNTEDNPVVIWYNGINHYQTIVPPNHVPSWGNERLDDLRQQYAAEIENRRDNPPVSIYEHWPALPGHLGND